MKIERTARFKKAYKKLPESLRKKFKRQLGYLLTNSQHPSLHTKKVQGSKNIWEARVDYQHRFTFTITSDHLTLRTIGPHDILNKP